MTALSVTGMNMPIKDRDLLFFRKEKKLRTEKVEIQWATRDTVTCGLRGNAFRAESDTRGEGATGKLRHASMSHKKSNSDDNNKKRLTKW